MSQEKLTEMERRVPLTQRTQGTVAATSSTVMFDSASRIQMATVQAGQAIIPAKSDLPRMLTGFEDQLSEFTFACKAPDDLKIIAIINKFSGGLGAHNVKSNPLSTIIYTSVNTGDYGCFHIEEYQNQTERVHETFGFKYQPTNIAKNLHVGMCLKKDEVLMQTPNIDPHGMYSTGISANVVYLSTAATTEDGFEVSSTLMERARPIATGSRVAEWGKRCFPLNIYGDDNNYKPFPEIGEKIRKDGVVFALREFDEVFAGLELTREALKQIDYVHDELIYGKPNAEVFDVNVHTTTNEGRRSKNTPEGMERLADKYSSHISEYYNKVLECYHEIRRVTRGDFKITPEFQNLIVAALGDKPNNSVRTLENKRRRGHSITKTWRANPIDEWRVEVSYQYKFPIGEGCKLSDRHGG